MDSRKFGAYIARLRKQHNLTQSQLADILIVTRQAVSKWELGDSFPDISLLPQLSDIFHVTIDQLIHYGEPGRREHNMITQVLMGMPEKASDLSELVKSDSYESLDEELLETFIPYLDDEARFILFSKILHEELNSSLLEALLPYLDYTKYGHLVEAAVLEGELDSDRLKYLQRGN